MRRTRTCATLVLLVLASCDSKQDKDTSLPADASVADTTTSEAASTATTSHAEHVTGDAPHSSSPSTVESNANTTTSDENPQNQTTPDATAEAPDGGDPSIDSGTPTDVSIATTGAAQDGADAGREISCDPRQLMCRRAAPTCDYGFVPRIVNGCYGECVAIDTCVCDGPEACPNEDRYTCNNSRQRCTPYLN